MVLWSNYDLAVFVRFRPIFTTLVAVVQIVFMRVMISCPVTLGMFPFRLDMIIMMLPCFSSSASAAFCPAIPAKS